MLKLLSLFFFNALLASADVFPMTPEQSAYVIIHYELDTSADLLSWANTETNKQLQALDKVYTDAGYELRVSFSYSQAKSADKGEFYMGVTQDMTVEEYIAKATESLEGFAANYTKSDEVRRINNVLAAGGEMFKYEAPTTRRVLLAYTDTAPTPFGNFDGDALSPYTEMTSNVDCSQKLVKARLAQGGVLLAALGTSTAASSAVSKALGAQFRKVLPDFGLDGNALNDSLDTIEYHLSRLLSPGYLATTSTTVAPNPTLCIQEAVAQCLGCSA